MKVSSHIFNLLKENDCVIIPNFGAFVCRKTSAKLSSDGKKIFPPNKEISFNKKLIKSDGLLTGVISQVENISYVKAEKKINNWLLKINNKLKDKGFVNFEKIGSLELKNSKYSFYPKLNSIILKSSFGFKNIDSTLIHRDKMRLERINKTFLKYAAIFIVLVGLVSIFSDYYFNSVTEYNETAYIQANKKIEQEIEKATFNISASLPAVKLFVKKKTQNYHIIAGAFRKEKNALKMLLRLENKGFTNCKRVGVNNYGLIQISYNSFSTIEEAKNALSKIRITEDKSAWLLKK
tara:strand:- start:1101 stop:1979 length:879 start_codon:yes stop_codon:yes gene_type:complete